MKARASVVYQMPYPDKQRAFVGSIAPTEEQAQSELVEWAGQQGFQNALPWRMFTTYHGGQAREWVLMERAHQPSSLLTSRTDS